MKYPCVELAIVGAQKAATTALRSYVANNDSIAEQLPIEFDYFCNDEKFEMGYDSFFDKYMKYVDGQKVIIKNVALSLNPKGLHRLWLQNPNCKIVLILREPAQRAYSAYSMAKSDGWMRSEFSALLAALDDGIDEKDNIMIRHFFNHGIYATQIKSILKYFKISNLRIYYFDDISSHAQEMTSEIWEWLGVENSRIDCNPVNVTTATAFKSDLSFKIYRLCRSYVAKLIKNRLRYSYVLRINRALSNLLKEQSTEKNPHMDELSKKKLEGHYKNSISDLRDIIIKNNIYVRSFGSSKWLL